MTTGLLTLLDDVVALLKVSAASLDDIPAQIAKTSGKVSGIVIDDAAVTPKYVVGLEPSRELSIIYNIAKKSLINKMVLLGPAALILGLFVPGAIQPLLMLGGAYLCFEGYEKLHSMFSKPSNAHQPAQVDHLEVITPEELEKIRIKGAVRTDFILSAEIIAITYASVADKPMPMQIIVMLCVAVAITIAVYGFVGLIVKADDIGLYMAKGKHGPLIQGIGHSIVKCMPHFLTLLSYVGTVAMLWVGGEIIAHGIPLLHHELEYLQQSLAEVPVLAWLGKALICALGGIIVGAIIEKAVACTRILLQSASLKAI